MQEPTTTRFRGSDVAWSGWPARSDRAEARRPEAVRAEAAAAGRAAPTSATPSSGDGRAPALQVPEQKDALFPRAYARFEINAKTQQLSIKIVDAATDEVIREIPPEEVQRIAEDLQSLARRRTVGRRPGSGQPFGGGGVDHYA